MHRAAGRPWCRDIKLEPPSGDDYRHIGPFKDGESALFTLNNRGKKSIILDLKKPADMKLAQALAARVDVVVENFRPGVATRLGLECKELQPTCSVEPP